MLCATCSGIKFAEYFQDEVGLRYDDMYLGSPSDEAVCLGSLMGIYDKKDYCNFCRLLVKSLGWNVKRRVSSEEYLEQARRWGFGKQCYIYSYLCASNSGTIRKIEPSKGDPSVSQKAYRIGIGLRSPQDSYNVFLDHAGDIQLLGTSAATIGKPDLFFGRIVDSNRANVGLAKSWLRMCEFKHGRKCETPAFDSQGARLYASPDDLLVVDVEQMSLSRAASDARYVALSYCWPQDLADNLSTTLSTLSEMLRPESLKTRMSNISPIIQDAIEFVRELGERFLWVDALCIIQDGGSRKLAQLQQMDLIYGAAALTIICAPPEAITVTPQGLPGYRTGSRICSQSIEKVDGLTLATSLADLDSIVMNSRWNKRAWTFQEDRLSKRKLFFTEQQLYFQCSCAVYCEDAIGEGCVPTAFIHCDTSLWNTCGMDAPQLQMQESMSTRISGSVPSTPVEDMDTYARLFNQYSLRNMSFAGDIIFAFQGILSVLKRTMKTPFLAGLPERYLHQSLLWLPTGPQQRRTVFTASSTSVPYPSWTWAGWVTSARYGGIFDGFILPEVDWFVIDNNGPVVKLNATVTYDPLLFTALGPDNKDVRPGYLPVEFSGTIRPREQISIQDGIWVESHVLASWTTIASFTLTGKYFCPKTIAPVDFGTDFQSYENMIIYDRHGNAAGSILLESFWHNELYETPRTFEFILLSRSYELTGMRFFDTTVFPERRWCHINVMLVLMSEGIASRLGVGVIHEDAWVDAEPTPALIKLG